MDRRLHKRARPSGTSATKGAKLAENIKRILTGRWGTGKTHTQCCLNVHINSGKAPAKQEEQLDLRIPTSVTHTRTQHYYRSIYIESTSSQQLELMGHTGKTSPTHFFYATIEYTYMPLQHW